MKKFLFLQNLLLPIFFPIILTISCNDNSKAKDLSEEITKLQDFTTTDSANDTNNDLSSANIGDDITSKFKKVDEVRLILNNQLTTGPNKPFLNSFSSGISIHNVVVKTPYNFSTKKLEVTITLVDANNSNISNYKKDIIITFDILIKDLSSEIAKLQNFTTIDSINKEGNEFDSLDSGLDDIKSRFNAISEVSNRIYGNNKPMSQAFSPGVSIRKVLLKFEYGNQENASNQITLTIILQYESSTSIRYKLQSYHKDIKITFS